MSKIYGFGNALVDIEIQIDEDQLITIGIPKGSMKHIGIDEKEELLKKYKDTFRYGKEVYDMKDLYKLC